MEFGRGIPYIPRAGGRGLPMMDRQTAEERSPEGWGQMRLLHPLPLTGMLSPGKRRAWLCVSVWGASWGCGKEERAGAPQSHPHALWMTPTN